MIVHQLKKLFLRNFIILLKCFAVEIRNCDPRVGYPHGKNIYVRYMSKYIRHVLDIYFNDAGIWFRGQKSYTSHIYFIFIGVPA